MTRRPSWAPDRLALAVAVALTAAAIARYPGGTFLDESSRGYSFASNFLGDLGGGGSVAFNYQRNPVGAALFGLAIALGVFALGACTVASVRVLSAAPNARPFARLAAAAVSARVRWIPRCGGLASRSVDGLHQGFSLTAVLAFPVLTMLLAAATMRDDRFRRQATAGWIVLTLVLAGCIVVGHFGADARTPRGLTVQVLAQKVMAIAAILLLWLESRELALVAAPTAGGPPTCAVIPPTGAS